MRNRKPIEELINTPAQIAYVKDMRGLHTQEDDVIEKIDEIIDVVNHLLKVHKAAQ